MDDLLEDIKPHYYLGVHFMDMPHVLEVVHHTVTHKSTEHTEQPRVFIYISLNNCVQQETW